MSSISDISDTQHLLSPSSSLECDTQDMEWEKKKPSRRKGYIRFSRRDVIALSKQLLHNFTIRPLGLRRKSPVTSLRKRIVVAFLNSIVATIAFLIFFSIANAILFPSYANPPAHYGNLATNVIAGDKPGRGNPRGEKIFIAANIIQADLIKGVWGENLVKLIELLGEENVFVSIYENDSGEASRRALRELAGKLKCPFSIITGAHLPLSDFPSVVLPNGNHRVKRLTYLSHLRNELLRPLDPPPNNLSHGPLQINYTNTRFNRILFLNDIYYNPVDALQLLFSTNQDQFSHRAEYDVACAIDFVASVMFYDTFVVRDTEGYSMGLMFFPWFTQKSSATSRNDVLAEKDAVRVKSCWGGMAAYNAAPFLRQPNNNTALRFRHQGELYWEASECCLLNADIATREPDAKVFINPYVRVAYDTKTWGRLPLMRRFEKVFSILQYVVSGIGYPETNPRRMERGGEVSRQKRWVYWNESLNGEGMRDQRSTVEKGELGGEWEWTEEVAQPGGFCGMRRLFVMKGDDIGEANRKVESSGRNWEKGPWPEKKVRRGFGV
ncbi:hypothetical protein EJ08DRAFT_697651 [Tothia fuscella]|uniref:Glycosyltransferase family 69 protein n=1 Tax=Tothia fuscella TaxID=1048955 RepID=A0A9P4NRT6_9PEZI|nr:hypothetical protein EJ08DRAFT_697651 [Tothia fuscella]